jgi:hypothetical protein
MKSCEEVSRIAPLLPNGKHRGRSGVRHHAGSKKLRGFFGPSKNGGLRMAGEEELRADS